MKLIFSLTIFWGAVAAASHEVYGIAGSGTTNPSKCYWSILEQLEVRSKLPMHNTYRAVGSTTGIAEFLNNKNYGSPANDFGSGDLPLNKTVYDTLTANNVSVVHLPVLLGAVSFFHSAPVEKLNLTACLLARIMKRNIKQWNDTDLVKLNPEFKTMKDLPPITVGRRVLGSSSTDSVTNYMHDACPDEWPESMTGPLITWPEDTEKCEGSGAMTTCIDSIPGMIGYIDAGHGIAVGLKEIELQNMFGTYQNSEQASLNGGIIAAENGVIPDQADADFSAVSLLNRPGKYTWPIVQMTYIYVPKDLSYIEEPQEQALLVAYLKAMYIPSFVQECVDEYGFTLPSNETVQMALAGINMLQVSENATAYSFEDSTSPILGHGDFVLSSKRQSIGSVELVELMDQVTELSTENEMLKSNIQTLQANMGMTNKQEQQLMAALILSSISFTLLISVMCLSVWRSYWRTGHNVSDTRQFEGDAIAKAPPANHMVGDVMEDDISKE